MPLDTPPFVMSFSFNFFDFIIKSFILYFFGDQYILCSSTLYSRILDVMRLLNKLDPVDGSLVVMEIHIHVIGYSG